MKQKILIIEDEAGIVDNIVYALKAARFTTFWSPTGKGGIDIIQKEDIDLIILDVGLPDINGFDLFKEIKKNNNIPVIFLTARVEEIDRVVGLELGADDYVTKPFSPRELTARVKAVLRRISEKGDKTMSDKPEIPENFPFQYNEKKKVMTYFGQPLKISFHEIKILEILVKHPGWVYSRQQLMDMAWEEPDSSLVRTVDAHIKNLRHKLKEINTDIDPIITHRGCGYSLREDW
ncbi:MAG: two-component system response regulator CreB [Candidatus Aminicenantes bacterium]|nr:two-component system response regulator CreB [Candidatus Aminicenantes bacterium]